MCLDAIHVVERRFAALERHHAPIAASVGSMTVKSPSRASDEFTQFCKTHASPSIELAILTQCPREIQQLRERLARYENPVSSAISGMSMGAPTSCRTTNGHLEMQSISNHPSSVIFLSLRTIMIWHHRFPPQLPLNMKLHSYLLYQVSQDQVLPPWLSILTE
jgi:hypothetical protein